ncbi:hypothetical protein FKM82_002912 [Ascaphus truei]
MDTHLDNIAWVGLAISTYILLTGCANMILMATLWILYHSLVGVGQIWLGISAPGNWVSRNLPVPPLVPLQIPGANPAFSYCDLVVSLAHL